MASDPLRITLDTLRSEREGAEQRAIELRDKLDSVGQRLVHLRGAIENIEALLGVSSVEDEAVVPDRAPERSVATVREIDFSTVTGSRPSAGDNDEDPDFGPFAPTARKRVPSTDWVAEVVNEMGHPADRDAIFDAFKRIKGFPTSWTNPRNSVNNALGRAVERDMVMKLGENLFAPKDYDPFADHFPQAGGRSA